MSETSAGAPNQEPRPNDPHLFRRAYTVIRERARSGAPVGFDRDPEALPGTEDILTHGFSAMSMERMYNPKEHQFAYAGDPVTAQQPHGYQSHATWSHPLLSHENPAYFDPTEDGTEQHKISLLTTTEGGLAVSGCVGRIGEEFDLGTDHAVSNYYNLWQDGTATVMQIDDNPSNPQRIIRQLTDEELALVVGAVEASVPISE